MLVWKAGLRRPVPAGLVGPAAAVALVALLVVELATPADIIFGTLEIVPVIVALLFAQRRWALGVAALAVAGRGLSAAVDGLPVALACLEGASYVAVSALFATSSRGQRPAGARAGGAARAAATTSLRHYCIAFTMRSGSTALCHDLESMGLGHPDEHFQEERYQGAEIARYIADQAANAGGVFGFKISWEQLETFCRNLAAQGTEVPAMDLRSVFPGLRMLHIVRRDKVRQAISCWRASMSGVWHIPVGSDAKPGRPDYDFDGILPFYLQITCDDWLWEQHFARLGVDVLTVSYEDYMADRDAELRRVVDFLGVQPASELQPVEKLQVMRDDWTDRMAERFLDDVYHPRPGMAAHTARTYWTHADLRSHLRRIAEMGGRLDEACEIGTGAGLMAPVLREFCAHVVGYERDAELLAQARAQYGAEVDFTAVERLWQLPAADGAFDVALLMTVLQSLSDEDVARVAAEVCRVLRPGGFVLLCEETDPLHQWRDARRPEAFTIGRAPEAYEKLFAPLQVVASSPRRVERTYPRPDVGSYLLLRAPQG